VSERLRSLFGDEASLTAARSRRGLPQRGADPAASLTLVRSQRSFIDPHNAVPAASVILAGMEGR
jgi:hypothetical protein